jgi:transcription elongation factor S-II
MLAGGVMAADAERKALFSQMLHDKFEDMSATFEANGRTRASGLQCRRCKSTDVAWEQKQTRGADEAMTVFCSCATCGNRWTMR